MSASADPLRNTLDHLALDPSAADDRRYLISMLRRLGYSEREIDIALGERDVVEIEYKKAPQGGFSVVEDAPEPEDWPDDGMGFSVTRGSVAKAGGDPAVEFGWRPVETQQEIHLPVEVDEPWIHEDEVHEGEVEFVERDDEWVEAADEDVEEGDEVEWVAAEDLEVEEGDEVEWEETETADADWEGWEESEDEEADGDANAWADVPETALPEVQLKEKNAPYAPPPRMGGGGGAVEEVPDDYIVSEPPGRVWDEEEEEDEGEAQETDESWDDAEAEDAWDTDGDGTDDAWDTTGDGEADAWSVDDKSEGWDSDGDGQLDTWDTTGDGDADAWDTDGDGQADVWENGAFQFEDYTLYTRLVELSTGKQQRIYFFSKETPQNGDPAPLPNGYVVDTNERTGLPYLRRDADAGDPVRELVEDQERLRCMAMTQSGNRCKRLAIEDSDFCSVHHGLEPPAPNADPSMCHAIKRDGDQCRNHPREGSKYCASHKGWRGDKIDV